MLVIDENGYANYDKMTDKESVEKSIRINYLPNHIQMINYVVEKYFYAATAEENNLPMREIEKANIEDWNVIREDDAQKEYDPDFFKWDDYDGSVKRIA